MIIRLTALLISVLLSISLCAEDSPSVYILCYHTFKGNTKQDYDVPVEELASQIAAFKKHGFTFVSYDDIMKNRVKGTKNIFITIDDGHITVKDAYEKVFKPNGIKPHLFIYPAIIGRKDYMMNFNDIRNLVKEGLTVGSHGYHHLFVDQKLYDTDNKSFMQEVYKSRDSLEKQLGVKPVTFGYPFGKYSDITIEELKKAGYLYAFSLKQHPALVPFNKNENPLVLPRFMITKSSWGYISRMIFK